MTNAPSPAPRRLGRWALAAALLAAAGCGEGKSQITGAEVSGVVRSKNRPVTGGTVRLIDPADANRSMSGQILGDGTYKVVNVPVGELVAVVETDSAKADPRAFIALARAKGGKIDDSQVPSGPPLKFVPIDKKYNDPATSPLRVNVPGKGSHVQDLNLD